MKKFTFALFVFLLAASPIIVSTALAQPPSIQGTWEVDAVLTATPDPNEHVKPGFRTVDVWRINQQNGQAVLTTQAGSIDGRYFHPTLEFPTGVWKFEAVVHNLLNQPTLSARFEIVIVQLSANIIEGGSTVTYLGFNYAGGPAIPLGMESWRFDGKRTN